MAGLLDMMGSDDSMLGLYLMAAGAAKPQRTSLGEGLLGGLQMVQQRKQQQEDRAAQAEERKQRAAMQQMQLQQMQAALAQQQRAQEQQQQRQRYLGSVDPTAGPALPASMASGMAAGLQPNEIAALMPQQGKGPEYKVVGGSLVRIDGDRVGEAFRAPEKQDMNSLFMPGPDGKPMLNKALFDVKQQLARAGAANVTQSLMAPQPGVNDAGQPVFFQASRDGSAPSIVKGVKPANVDKATEDQSKAAGWLAQAENAYKNMQDAGLNKDGSPKSAAYPGPLDALESAPGVGGLANSLRSADRQKFIQASSSLSEALLRAATGAGVNAEEAKQKVQELTPRFGEKASATEQKLRSIPVYLQSLKVRAGPAGAKAAPPKQGDTDPLGIRGK